MRYHPEPIEATVIADQWLYDAQRKAGQAAIDGDHREAWLILAEAVSHRIYGQPPPHPAQAQHPVPKP